MIVNSDQALAIRNESRNKKKHNTNCLLLLPYEKFPSVIAFFYFFTPTNSAPEDLVETFYSAEVIVSYHKFTLLYS